ncbi:MAG: hypothetical protein IH840_08725 [Candidatus Heimdallarchaeota archaeon]|nr:hypothetical protein [Candidatus Heimdallarchaeota archaeon]
MSILAAIIFSIGSICLKDLIQHTRKNVQIDILKTLINGNLPKTRIKEQLPDYSDLEMDEAMRLLRRNQFVHYHRHSNCWRINEDP